MSWNYRIVCHINCSSVKNISIPDWWGVHEVYDEKHIPEALTEDSVGIIGDSFVNLIKAFQMFKKAFTKPVLTYDHRANGFVETNTAQGKE